jgi:hypothetical protein
MKNAYFVDTSAYLAYAKNEFWTPVLKVEKTFAPQSILTELNNVINYDGNQVKLNSLEMKRLENLVNDTTIVPECDISEEVYDAHKRSILRKQILNPHKVMGERDISLVNTCNNFAIENKDSNVFLFTADSTMASAVNLIDRDNLVVIEPFSKTFFDGTKKIKPHFALEDAISDLSVLKNSFPTGENIYGNVLVREGIGYVYSFTEGPGVESDQFNKSYLINLGVVSKSHKKRICEMYERGGVFSMIGNHSLGLTISKNKPSNMKLLQVRKNLHARNNSLFIQTVSNINKEFNHGHNSVVYTICKDQLNKVAGEVFFDNICDKREKSLFF